MGYFRIQGLVWTSLLELSGKLGHIGSPTLKVTIYYGNLVADLCLPFTSVHTTRNPPRLLRTINTPLNPHKLPGPSREMAMDAAHIALMNAEEIHQSLTTIHCDQAYQCAVKESQRIYEEEQSRNLRLQQLLLAHENDALKEQLAELEAQWEDLENQKEDAQERLDQLDAELQRAQSDLRARTREADRYKAELHAMNTVTTDSTKILTEKLALAREVATLKPEIDHLRSQAALNQNILAEKLALERELNSLQVELETERRALQRTKANASKATEADLKLASQLEELKKDLAKERREGQRMEREARKQATEWESQKAILESKLDAFRNKLRSTKEQLKETQKELEENQELKAQSSSSALVNRRKRQTAHFDPDASIGTPGNNGVHAAKRLRTSTLPGDKSTFSITPFLNKTVSILLDTPDASEQEKPDHGATSPIAGGEQASPIHLKQAKARKLPATSGKKKESHVLQETNTASRANRITRKGSISPTKKKPFNLPKVMEEGNGENEGTAPSEPSRASRPAVKKKQKILGQRKSLFDDNDAEETKRRARTVGMLGTSRGLGLRGGGLASISLGTKGKPLTEFSPLKKDRRPPPVSASSD